MSSSANVGAGQYGRPTGDDDSAEEPGTFLTDQPPTADTPAEGSSNAGINAVGANRADYTEDDGERTRQ